MPTGAASARAAPAFDSTFCQQHAQVLSSGALTYCFGGSQGGTTSAAAVLNSTTFSKSNVDAASFAEDRTPNGTQARGQSEPSIAADGHYVVEAWNDSTTFYSGCGAPLNQEEGTGFGFSNNGGASFKDLGGLPNANCHSTRYFGDSSVVTWVSAGQPYFYISSLFIDGVGNHAIAVTACTVDGAGTSARLVCGQPIEMAVIPSSPMLDKDFLAIDRTRGRLYVSYTDFTQFGNSTNGQIELAVCDLGTATGDAGPVGGTATAPVCPQPTLGEPEFVVSPGADPCVQSGSYPAVDETTADVYVGWEFNWVSSFEACASQPVRDDVALVPAVCMDPTQLPSACAGPKVSNGVPLVSLANLSVPGYEVNAVNDFPRVAVSRPFRTVSLVYNAADKHPTGDIFMQSFALGSLKRIQLAPLRLNTDVSTPFKLLPAAREAKPDGTVEVSWYDRRFGDGTPLTDVVAASIGPRDTSTPRNQRVTDVSSDWTNTTSDIIPNFGDYADNAVALGSGTVYIAWSDGRSGEPQPYAASGG